MTNHSRYLDIAWDKAAKLFSTRRYARPSFAWLRGFSERLYSNRVRRLINKKQATQLNEILTDLTDQDFIQFRTRALVNLEQAGWAFRSTIVFNISIPIAVLVITNQIFPGWIASAMQALLPERDDFIYAIFVLGFGAFVMALLSIFAFSALSSARDLKQLTDLHAARRGHSDLFQTVEEKDSKFDLSSPELP